MNNNIVQSFVFIEDKYKKNQIEEFINNLFKEKKSDVQLVGNEEIFQSISGEKLIRKIMECIKGDFTVVIENYHIDKVFRDSYYMYFSNQHFQVERYCKRLSFFIGKYTWNSFLNCNESEKNKLKNDFVGCCVIKPITEGFVGRTLLNPKYFLEKGSAYLRKSKYVVNIYGVALEIEAFPYRMQDRETMRCSEVTVLNLMDYYANTYNDYKSVVPSEIMAAEQRHIHERVLPSRGITYHVLTKILTDFGFSPRLYNVDAMKKDEMSGITQQEEMRRILHYYVESGIPVAVNVDPITGKGMGHSLVCIGHSNKISYDKAIKNKKIVGEGFDGQCGIINSADFYDEYIVIDDNQFPYSIRNFEKMSIYSNMQVSNISVPLYKRMFLEATHAHDIALEIIESNVWGAFKWAEGYLNGKTDIIIRLFLASSRSFKRERVASFGKESLELQLYYAKVRMPQFVWVCELYTEEGYKNGRAFGELVLDGTSALKKGIKNLIILNYPSRLYARNPDVPESNIDKCYFKIEKWCEIESYKSNLQCI